MGKIKIDNVEEFHSFMTGINPKGLYVDPPLNLSRENAMTIIWYLQEHLRIIPDNYEMCSECGQIFDSNFDGYYLSADAISDSIQDARWPTYENYCCYECLQQEINRQADIIFESFDDVKYQLRQGKCENEI